jgi:Tyrosyl-DNA phosphodiesterase
MSPPDRKRQRTDGYSPREKQSIVEDIRSRRSAFLASLNRGISPPGRASPVGPEKAELKIRMEKKPETETMEIPAEVTESQSEPVTTSTWRIISSPFKLTRIRDLPDNANADTVGIRDILGDVMLKEVWLFDFLYDVDWVM